MKFFKTASHAAKNSNQNFSWMPGYLCSAKHPTSGEWHIAIIGQDVNDISFVVTFIELQESHTLPFSSINPLDENKIKHLILEEKVGSFETVKDVQVCFYFPLFLFLFLFSFFSFFLFPLSLFFLFTISNT